MSDLSDYLNERLMRFVVMDVPGHGIVTSGMGGSLTETELRQVVWEGKHAGCVRYVEFGIITECVTCGEERPL